ncbi:MAG: hypothetical protein IJS82_05290 [Paludibacteraceae bacterium]|nr:hypothetical protein [Paludibacteraceae bacterium]
MAKPIKNIPHGTGVPYDQIHREETAFYHVPNVLLKLWLSATRLAEDGSEYPLTEEERQELNEHRLKAACLAHDKPHRHLDEPWFVRISDGTNEIAPELRIRSWMAYKNPYDGHSLLIMHEMPWMRAYQPAPTSKLVPGGTIVAEYILEHKNNKYDVRLFIHWPPEQEIHSYTLTQTFDKLREIKSQWTSLYIAEKHEIEVLLGHNGKRLWEYKSYSWEDFPEQFITDIQADKSKQEGLDHIGIQPYELYQHYRHHSEDYQIVAKAYGLDDYEDGYVTERKKVGERLEWDIINNQ